MLTNLPKGINSWTILQEPEERGPERCGLYLFLELRLLTLFPSNKNGTNQVERYTLESKDSINIFKELTFGTLKQGKLCSLSHMRLLIISAILHNCK